jgi:tryptophanyl-tRNA synthetase
MTKTTDKKVLLSGVKPTGRPHIGNYFGAMKQFVDMQDEYDARIFVANYHAFTGSQTPEEMKESTLDVVIDYLAIGLDPQKANIFLQTDVPEVTELMWIFDCITTMPYLQRAHAYKDAQAKGEEINVGTFNYPMLMAADILMQDADVVPVGADQKQHLEIARDTAEKFNRLFGETFKLPKPVIMEDVKTIPGTDGRKMSKSYGNTIPLFAEDEEIKKAVMSIVTDSKSPEEPKNPEEDNIFALHKLFSTEELLDIEKRYKEGGMGYKESKEILIKNIISFIAPLREKRKEIAKDKDAVLKILENSGNIARSTAKAKMMEVRERVGLNI